MVVPQKLDAVYIGKKKHDDFWGTSISGKTLHVNKQTRFFGTKLIRPKASKGFQRLSKYPLVNIHIAIENGHLYLGKL